MSSISSKDLQVLRKISDHRIDMDNISPDLSERIDYLVTFGLARYSDDAVILTDAGHRMLADYKPSASARKPARRTQRRKVVVEEQQRETHANGGSSCGLLSLAFVYILGLLAPEHIKLRIIAFLDPIIDQILDFINSFFQSVFPS